MITPDVSRTAHTSGGCFGLFQKLVYSLPISIISYRPSCECTTTYMFLDPMLQHALFFYEKSFFFNNTNFRYKKFNENREVSFFSLCTHTPFLHEPRLYPIKSHAPRRHALADGIRTLLSCEVVPGASSVLLRGVGRRTFLHRALVLDDSTDLRPGNTRGCISSRLHKKVRRFQKKNTHTH